MGKIFCSYALCRSGYHAITYWLFAHFKNSIYINDPLIAKIPLTNKFVYGNHNPPPAFDLSKHLKTKSNVFTGFPDNSLSKSFLAEPGECPYEERRVIVLRDPFNMFASRAQHMNLWTFRRSPHQILPLWKEHAREFLGMTDLVKSKKILVNYNEWFRSYAYRQSLTQSLEGDKIPGSSVIEYISPWGFGSSFDFRAYNGKAFQMKVLERWKTKQDDRLYLSLFDDEVVALSRNIFGSKFVDNILSQLGMR